MEVLTEHYTNSRESNIGPSHGQVRLLSLSLMYDLVTSYDLDREGSGMTIRHQVTRPRLDFFLLNGFTWGDMEVENGLARRIDGLTHSQAHNHDRTG